MARFRSKAYDYREIAYKCICECIRKRKFGKPPVGFYHIVSIDFVVEKPLFYRVTHDHVETTDKLSHDIIDNVYYIRHALQLDEGTGKIVDNNPDELQVSSLIKDEPIKFDDVNKWRHFELTT